MKSILIIDDCSEFRVAVRDLLSAEGYDVHEAPTTFDAFEVLRRDDVDLILCDLHLPFVLDHRHFEYQYSLEVGMRTVEELCGVFPDRPVVAMSAAIPDEVPMIRERLSQVPFVLKPCKLRDLVEVIQTALGDDPTEIVQ